MNEADRKALEEHHKDTEGCSRRFRSGFTHGFIAGCEWRDSQVGEAAYIVGLGWQRDEMPERGTILYEAPPTAQINQQLLGALELAEAKQAVNKQLLGMPCVTENDRSIILNIIWQAACEWMRSQREPVAWCNYNPLTGEKWYSDSKECVNAEPLYANAPIAENQKAVGKFVWIATCAGGYWYHLYKGNEPPSTSKTVFLYAEPPAAQINEQMREALQCLLAAVQNCHCENSGAAQELAHAALTAATPK